MTTSSAVAIVENARIVLRRGMVRIAPSDGRGKLDGVGDGDGVDGIGVGRVVKA